MVQRPKEHDRSRVERSSHGLPSSSSSNGSAQVVPTTSKKPVRSKPMRGPGAQTADLSAMSVPSGSRADLLRRAESTATMTQASLKEDFCTQLLMGGYVQSFVDMFYLTHRSESQTHKSGGMSDAEAIETCIGGAALDVSEMQFLRDQLVTAEHCKRKGAISEVLSAYDSLATYCMEKGDIKTMLFFYEKCLEIARLVKDAICEMRVLNKIGSGYHSLLDLDKAREYQELYVSVAQVIYEHEDDDELRGEAFLQLGKVYTDLAEKHEDAREFQASIDYYKKMLECATKANDARSIAQAQFKIGACYNALLEPANALPFLEAYLATCRKTGNVDGEGSACAELATAHERLENKQLSIDFLNHYVTIATKAGSLVNQADACRRLGHIYTASHDFPRAREMHEKTYELLPAIPSRRADAFNCARIDLGSARANDKMSSLLKLVKDDLRGLLEWKNARTLPTAD